MKQISPQTKSFFILFSIAVAGTFLCLMLWANLKSNLINKEQATSYQAVSYSNKTPAHTEEAPQSTPTDTSNWQTYTNTKYGFSFKYKPDWKVLAATKKNGFTVIQVDPGKKYYNFQIYISPKEFFAMDNLPSKTETIGGAEAINVSGYLYGIKANNLFYTFDIGTSAPLKDDFDGMVYSLNFTK